jgi:hypothetical protein
LKTKTLVPIITSILSAIVLIVMACTQANPQTTTTPTNTPTQQPNVTAPAPVTTTTTVEVDRKYNVVDPTGIFKPVQTQALTPRLDTIDGKTIYVCQGEADPVIMPALIKRLIKGYPKTTFIYYDRSDFGPTRPGTGGASSSTNQPEDPDILKKVQGVIRGIGW